MGSYQPPRPSQKPSLQFDTVRLAVDLFDKYVEKLQTRPGRVLVAVAGNTGIPKNTIASMVANHLNRIHAQETGRLDWSFAVRLPMRDLNLAKAPSVTMSEHKHCQGLTTTTTSHAQAFGHFVRQMRRPLTTDTKTISWPTSNSAVKDTTTEDVVIEPRSKIILLDGIHDTLEQPPWSDIAMMMDEVWFVETDLDIGGEMLSKRYALDATYESEASASASPTLTVPTDLPKSVAV